MAPVARVVQHGQWFPLTASGAEVMHARIRIGHLGREVIPPLWVHVVPLHSSEVFAREVNQ